MGDEIIVSNMSKKYNDKWGELIAIKRHLCYNSDGTARKNIL